MKLSVTFITFYDKFGTREENINICRAKGKKPDFQYLLYLIVRGASKVVPINLQDAVSRVQLVGVTGRTSFQHILDEDASHRGRTETAAIS